MQLDKPNPRARQKAPIPCPADGRSRW